MTNLRPKPPTPARHGPNADARAANSVPRAVSALASSYPRGHVIASHRHPRAQLIFAVEGAMSVRAAGSMWTVPATHALWMPAGVDHEIQMASAVEMRSLYLDPKRLRNSPSQCQVFFVTPLLRELIVAAMDVSPLYDERGRDGRLMQLIVDELARLVPRPLGLRMPADPRLARLCERVLEDLSSSASIAERAGQVGLSERSVIRLFPRETGLSFGRWQQQARLLRAFALFDQGASVTRVALELGYASPAAFTKMFRRLLGASPRALRERAAAR